MLCVSTAENVVCVSTAEDGVCVFTAEDGVCVCLQLKMCVCVYS